MIKDNDSAGASDWWPSAIGAAIGIAVALALRPRVMAMGRTSSADQNGRDSLVRTLGFGSGSTPTSFIEGLDAATYGDAVMRAFVGGDAPESFGQYVPVEVRSRGMVGVFWAAPWHLAVGTDSSSFHAPLSASDAQRLCDRLGQSLPTRRMVDAIRSAAGAMRLPFRAFAEARSSLATYLASSEAIERDRAGRVGLLYGYAKDYVVTNHLRGYRGNIAIYGGVDGTGNVIQGLNFQSHNLGYVDYSQKPRLIGSIVTVDGSEVALSEALTRPETAHLFSDEGVIPVDLQRYPT